jgi:ATP-dependent helicase/nuclease subunit B
MALALSNIGSRLKVYSSAQRKAELQASLLSAIYELKTACIGSEELMQTAAGCRDSLGDKLSDLALILEAYEAVVANGHAAPADRLSLLARQVADSHFNGESRIYVDGFTGRTRKQIFSVGAFSYKGGYKKAKEMAEEMKMSYEYIKTINII